MQRRQRRVGGMHGVAEALERCAARRRRCRCWAPRGRRSRRSPRRPRAASPPSSSIRQPASAGDDVGDAARSMHDRRAPRAREREQPIAHVARAAARRGRASPTRSPRPAGCRASRSKKAICSRERPRADDLAQRVGRRVGDEARSRRARAGSMLQRPPPLMRILRPPSAVRSRSGVSAPAAAAKIAAIVPAAPAPMTATRAAQVERLH